jgi:hypothetical protein
LDHVVKHHRDHVRLLHDLSNSTTLTQKIFASLIFSITEIIIIEDYKLYDTFLHVAFKSQSLLNPISDQIGSDINWRTGEGDQTEGECEPIKNSSPKLGLCPKSNPTSLF